MFRNFRVCALSAVAFVVGCGTETLNTARNGFLTLTETFGSELLGEDDEAQGGSGGEVAASEFRAPMTLTLLNLTTSADLNVRVAAWVNVSSVRTVEQEDALFRAGYVQLDEDVRIGEVFDLPAGTFVLDGRGLAGSRTLFLPASVGEDMMEEAPPTEEEEGASISSEVFDLVTPDAILLFWAPPVSCESVGFEFTQDGQPVEDARVDATGLIFGGSGNNGGLKTLGQFDVYQCQPFRPGLFLKQTGGGAEPNEYFEGDDITVEFRRFPTAGGIAATVRVGQ